MLFISSYWLRQLIDVLYDIYENNDYRYLPGVKIPDNIIAVPDLTAAVKDATVLVFVLPHQVSVSYIRYFVDSFSEGRRKGHYKDQSHSLSIFS